MSANGHTVSTELAKQWEALHQEMNSSQRTNPLAKVFLGHKPSEYELQERRILYVGKATAGGFDGDGVHEDCFNGTSAFWGFAREVSEIAGCKDSSLTNLAWSNVSKIGVVVGNPDERLQLAQKALAVMTLRQEIAALNPSIVVFVCDGHADETVYEATYAKRGGLNDFESVSSQHKTFYSRQAIQVGTETLPPMIWLNHPQLKEKEHLSEWLGEVKRLLSVSSPE